jgi:FixJ family two-component response regulator
VARIVADAIGSSPLTEEQLIAIVDDDASVVEATKELVETMGFRTEAFGSAKAFLESEAVVAASCLILDVQMPEIDGLELKRRLTCAHRDIPTIFITGLPDERIVGRTRKEGAVACLRKPIGRDELLKSIHLALGDG